MLGLDRSMSQPNLVHLAQMVASAPLSACPSEASESADSQTGREEPDIFAPLPAALVALPGVLEAGLHCEPRRQELATAGSSCCHTLLR